MISELCWVESCHGLSIEVGHIALAVCAVIYILMKLKLHGTYSTALLNWWIGKSILIFHFTIWQIHCSHCPHQGLESLYVRVTSGLEERVLQTNEGWFILFLPYSSCDVGVESWKLWTDTRSATVGMWWNNMTGCLQINLLFLYKK